MTFIKSGEDGICFFLARPELHETRGKERLATTTQASTPDQPNMSSSDRTRKDENFTRAEEVRQAAQQYKPGVEGPPKKTSGKEEEQELEEGGDEGRSGCEYGWTSWCRA